MFRIGTGAYVRTSITVCFLMSCAASPESHDAKISATQHALKQAVGTQILGTIFAFPTGDILDEFLCEQYYLLCTYR